MRHLGAIVLLCFLAASPAGAQGFDAGARAYQRGDYAAALARWRPLAAHGDPGAQYLLGLMSNWGRGVPPDYFAAVSWYHRAAEQGADIALARRLASAWLARHPR